MCEYHRTAASYNLGWLPSAPHSLYPRPPLITFAAWGVGAILPPIWKCDSEKLRHVAQGLTALGGSVLGPSGILLFVEDLMDAVTPPTSTHMSHANFKTHGYFP